MPPQTHQPLSESTLLTRYLLLPSSLPTILPYNAFLSLLTTSARNNEDLRPHLRSLYADLQSQRNIDLETIRNNIARECARAGTVKAQLRRDLARELDGTDITDGRSGANDDDDDDDDNAYIIDFKRDPSVELTPSRKRKRSDDEASEVSSTPGPSVDLDAEAASSSPHQEEIPESPNSAASTNSSSSIIHVTSPLAPSEPPTAAAPLPTTTTTSTTQTAHLDLLLDAAFHGPRGLALPSTTTCAASLSATRQHTKTSLLAAMEAAVQALEREVSGLEGQAREVMGQMRETVGGLSDLRYGSFAGRGSGGAAAAAGAGDGVEKELETGLRTLREVVGRKVREL